MNSREERDLLHTSQTDPFPHGESCLYDRSNLVIRPNALSGGSSYTFRLSAMDTGSLKTGGHWYRFFSPGRNPFQYVFP